MPAIDVLRGRQTATRTLTNRSGGAVAAGDVVVIGDGTNDNCFTTTTTASFNARMVGVAMEAIASLAAGLIAIHGYVPKVNTDASVTRDHFLFTHTVAKEATGSATRGAGAFGQVLETGADPEAIIWGMPDVTPGGSTAEPSICQGRLTLTTAVPITTADVTAATNVYFTPYKGARISTYSGAAWSTTAFAEKTLSLAGLAADTNFDVFIVDSTLALEALAWTDATNRATALVLQDGVLVKSGATTRRYLGTFRTTGTIGQTEDSLLKRYLWNYHHRVRRSMKAVDGTDSWTYAVTAWRQANAGAANKVELVVGVSEDLVMAFVHGQMAGASGVAGTPAGIGLDSTTANSAETFQEISAGATVGQLTASARYRGYPGIGYHYLAWLEYRRAGTCTMYGDGGVADMQNGISAEVLG